MKWHPVRGAVLGRIGQHGGMRTPSGVRGEGQEGVTCFRGFPEGVPPLLKVSAEWCAPPGEKGEKMGGAPFRQ